MIYLCMFVRVYVYWVCLCVIEWVCVYVWALSMYVYECVYTTCKHSVASLICFVYTLFLPFLCFSDFGVQLVKEQTFLVTALSVFLHCKYCK